MKKVLTLIVALVVTLTTVNVTASTPVKQKEFKNVKPSKQAYKFYFVWDIDYNHTDANGCVWNYTITYSMEFGQITILLKKLNTITCGTNV